MFLQGDLSLLIDTHWLIWIDWSEYFMYSMVFYCTFPVLIFGCTNEISRTSYVMVIQIYDNNFRERQILSRHGPAHLDYQSWSWILCYRTARQVTGILDVTSQFWLDCVVGWKLQKSPGEQLWILLSVGLLPELILSWKNTLSEAQEILTGL